MDTDFDFRKTLNFLMYILFLAIAGITTMLCWNYVMPYLFSLPKISIFQGYALIILSELMIKKTTIEVDKSLDSL